MLFRFCLGGVGRLCGDGFRDPVVWAVVRLAMLVADSQSSSFFVVD